MTQAYTKSFPVLNRFQKLGVPEKTALENAMKIIKLRQATRTYNMTRSRQRKPWHELFFAADGLTPLSPEETGAYKDALEAVRLGPSAANRQPWRIVLDKNGKFHLFMEENRFLNRAQGKVRVQNLDMGIAMCHFSLVAQEKGLPGRWERKGLEQEYRGWTYIASWQAV